MKDILCVNGSFPPDMVEFWEAHGVVKPEQDKMYTVREVVRHSNGLTGLRLEELVNPKVPIMNEIMGYIEIEPSFNINRFAHLDGSPVDAKELELEAPYQGEKQTYHFTPNSN